MATSGSLTTSSYDGRYYKLSWERTSKSIADNTSTIKWTLSAHGGNEKWYAERTLKVVIAGTTVKSKTSRVERYTGEIDSGTITITHNTDGSRNFTASIEAAVYWSSVNCTGSKTFTLDTIARKSTLTATNGTLGKKQTLTINEKDSTFKHKLKYECGTTSAWLLGTATSTSTDLSKPWTPSLNLAKQNTKGKSVSIKFILYTYTKGGALIGNSTYTKSFTIPENEDTQPSLSVSLSDPTGYYKTYGTYIQGKSKVKITSTVSGKYNATISSCKATFENKTYDKNPATSNVISSSGNSKSVSVTAVDSRGYTKTVSTPIDVCAYSKPTITLTPDRNGTSLKCTYKATFASVNSQNSATVKIYVDGVEKKSIANVSSGTTSTVSITLDNADKTYKVYAKVTDALGESSSTTTRTLIGGTRAMNVTADGTGVAFGMKASPDAYDFRKKVRCYDGDFVVKTNNHGLYLTNSSENPEPAIYRNSSHLWVGATATAGQHITGGTYISAGDKSDIYVSKLVNGTRTNYAVLDAENYTDYHTTHLYHSDGTGYVIVGKDGDYYYFRPYAPSKVLCGSANNPWYKTYTERLEVTVGRIVCKPTYDNTVTYATNMYVGTGGVFSRTTNTSSRTIKHDITELANDDLRAEKLYDVGVHQFKYNDGIITDTSDARYGKDLPGFIIEDLDEKYPIVVDKPSDDPKDWSWNSHYMIPPMLKLIQDQKKEIDELKERLDKLENAK